MEAPARTGVIRPMCSASSTSRRAKYGYDPGSVGEFSRRNNNDKVFVRTDFNLRTGSRLVVRHNYVKGLADNGSQTQFAYYMPDYFYEIQDIDEFDRGQLNSTLGSMFNELRVTYQRERNVRGSARRRSRPSRHPGRPAGRHQREVGDGELIAPERTRSGHHRSH